MKLNKIKKIIIGSSIIPLTFISSSCAENYKKSVEELRDEAIKNYYESLIIDHKDNSKKHNAWNLNLDSASIIDYRKNIEKHKLNNYDIITKQNIFNKLKKALNLSVKRDYEDIKKDFNALSKNYSYWNFEILESDSTEERLNRFLTSKLAHNAFHISDLRETIVSLYQDAFDTSLTYLISKYIPKDLYVYDVYNYIKELLAQNNINDFINEEEDNIFKIYNDSSIKTVIEIPVKMINFIRDNLKEELVVAYNEGSMYWDNTQYNDENIKEIMKHRNIEISPVSLRKPLYKKQTFTNINDETLKNINIETPLENLYSELQKASNFEEYHNLQKQIYNKLEKISSEYIRQYITNPYYANYIQKLKSKLNGIRGYQISYYGTKVRIYLDHDVTDEELEIIKKWEIYDDYVPEAIKFKNVYQYVDELDEITNSNFVQRDIKVFSDFQKYKDFILGTRIFADFRNEDIINHNYEYINTNIYNTDKSYDFFSSNSRVRNAFRTREIGNEKIANLLPIMKKFSWWSDNQVNALISNITKSGINWDGETFETSNNHKDYYLNKYDTKNIFPSLTAAIQNWGLDGSINNSEYFKNIGNNNVITYLDTIPAIYLTYWDMDYDYLNSWYSNRHLSLLPEKTIINPNTKYFQNLYKNNNELTYNLDWKVVSYSLIPYDLSENYSSWNQNYQELNNYFENIVQQNNVEIARIGIDQLSLR